MIDPSNHEPEAEQSWEDLIPKEIRRLIDPIMTKIDVGYLGFFNLSLGFVMACWLLIHTARVLASR